MAAVRKMLLVEARRSWETRGAPSPKLEELVTRLRPRVEMESEADLGWNGRGQLTGTLEAAQSPSNALKEAKNKLFIRIGREFPLEGHKNAMMRRSIHSL